MRTRVLAAPNAIISVGIARQDAMFILRAVERSASVFLTSKRVVSTIRDQWHYLLLSRNPTTEVGVRIRTDMFPGVEVHEWATPTAVVHFLLTGIDDRRFSAQALVLQIFAP